MARPTAAKSRAFRIPLDYYKTTDRLGRRKIALSLLALILATGWWIAGWARSPLGSHLATHGPVAAVHGRWENDCEACHTPFSPIKSHSWNASFSAGTNAANAKCEACHLGPEHHRNQLPKAADQSCASCHHDHAGRLADLNRTTSAQCVGCHADLGKHVAGDDTAGRYVVKELQIDDFASRHPNFRNVEEKKDPGRLKFNHKLHMTPGLTTSYTLAKLLKDDRTSYQSFADSKTGEIRLECASCHRLESNSSTSAPGSGQYFRPISYKNECRACHPTTVEPRKEGNGPSADAFNVPHGVQPQKVHEFLWGAYVAELAAKDPKSAELVAPTTSRIPGKNRDESADGSKTRSTIAGKVLGAERILFEGKTTCFECHRYDSKDADAGKLSLAGDKYPDFKIVSPDVPEVWFKHARFAHSAHRGVSCVECHANAYADSKNASTVATDVLVPGIENCRQCHAPESRDGQGRSIGGVRSDCVECHRYHDGDHAPSSPGSIARNSKEARSALEFLSGSSPKTSSPSQ